METRQCNGCKRMTSKDFFDNDKSKYCYHCEDDLEDARQQILSEKQEDD